VADAVCLNLTDPEERSECFGDARADDRETRGDCRDVYDARQEVCEALGEEAYDPEIDPADFVEGIDNPLVPFAVGSKWVYQKDGEDGLETNEIEVLDETVEILGIECTVIHDRVWLDGELVEDTHDWLAQDVDGNVWYLGEIAVNYEDGEIADLEGSWKAGEDGAKPGFWMPADPQAGDVYRQEWLPGEAEDVVEVIDTDSDQPVPFANGNPVLKTRDFTPLEPDVVEFKFYVPGVGMVLEVDPDSGETLELISYTP
jgi:hypothetical protein